MVTVSKVDENFDYSIFKGASCAFGVFDGVHSGHRFLIECARMAAQDNNTRSIILTFDIDPDELFHPERLQKLMSNDDRISCLSERGVDEVIVLPFTQEFASLAPDEFLETTFNGCAPESIHVGSDFRFGAKASGSVEDLNRWGEKVGTTIEAHNLISIDGKPVTSTRIRLLLKNTDISKANELLGRPYSIHGLVHPGRGEGSQLGFRTANLEVESRVQALGEGVYAAFVEVGGKRYKAAVSVGVSPTFKELTSSTCEAHIIDFEGEIYGDDIKVEFIAFLRPMMKFETVEELSKTVLSNISWTRENLAL